MIGFLYVSFWAGLSDLISMVGKHFMVWKLRYIEFHDLEKVIPSKCCLYFWHNNCIWNFHDVITAYIQKGELIANHHQKKSASLRCLKAENRKSMLQIDSLMTRHKEEAQQTSKTQQQRLQEMEKELRQIEQLGHIFCFFWSPFFFPGGSRLHMRPFFVSFPTHCFNGT